MLQKILDQVLHEYNVLLSVYSRQYKCNAAFPLFSFGFFTTIGDGLQFFPIIERELRVAARQPRTWWRRYVTLNLGVGVVVVAYFTTRQWSGSSEIGRDLFNALVVCGFIFGLLAGPLTTTDCLSRERREGTLGLLFLTSLRSPDVVLGKMAVSSFDIVLILLGGMPLVAMPFLMGGLDLVHFALTALALFNVMFFSLATGIFFSAFATSGRTALGFTLAFLFFVTLGLPYLAVEVLKLPKGTIPTALFEMVSPLITLLTVMELPSGGAKPWEYWTSMGGLHGFAWLFLLAACWRTARSWRIDSEAHWRLKWRERLASWRSRMAQTGWRNRLLDQSPIAWLESRRLIESAALFAVSVLALGFWFFKHLTGRDVWPDEDICVAWAIWAHYILCLWIAIQAPRRLADDKQSGALELLLCTPLTERQIVRGCTRALLTRFGTVALTMLLVDEYSLYFAFTQQWGGNYFQKQELIELALCGTLVIPVQTYTFMRLGIYQGLAQGNSLRATFILIAKVGLLPWALFIGALIAVVLSERFLIRWRVFNQWAGEAVIFGCWIAFHLLVCLAFLAHGNWRLKRQFRTLASHTVKPPWWKRFLPKGLSESA